MTGKRFDQRFEELADESCVRILSTIPEVEAVAIVVSWGGVTGNITTGTWLPRERQATPDRICSMVTQLVSMQAKLNLQMLRNTANMAAAFNVTREHLKRLGQDVDPKVFEELERMGIHLNGNKEGDPVEPDEAGMGERI